MVLCILRQNVCLQGSHTCTSFVMHLFDEFCAVVKWKVMWLPGCLYRLHRKHIMHHIHEPIVMIIAWICIQWSVYREVCELWDYKQAVLARFLDLVLSRRLSDKLGQKTTIMRESHVEIDVVDLRKKIHTEKLTRSTTLTAEWHPEETERVG